MKTFSGVHKANFILSMMLIAVTTLFSTGIQAQGLPLIGSQAPGFTANSTQGTLHFPSDFGRNWKIIFAHPADFTPVCSSELLEMAYLQNAFHKQGAKLIVVSVDSLDRHMAWKEALEQVPYKGRKLVEINFPLVADNDYTIVSQYGMVHPDAPRGPNIRGVFFIDRSNIVRAISFYPVEVGRNIDEILRTLIALQKVDDEINLATPANWVPGEPLMVTYPNPLMEENLLNESSIYHRYNWFMTYINLEDDQEDDLTD